MELYHGIHNLSSVVSRILARKQPAPTTTPPAARPATKTAKKNEAAPAGPSVPRRTHFESSFFLHRNRNFTDPIDLNIFATGEAEKILHLLGFIIILSWAFSLSIYL
jgi:hypothetical protein